jgi:hypothetical protein
MLAPFTEKQRTKQKMKRKGVKETLKLFEKRKKVNEFKVDKKEFEMFFYDDAVTIKKEKNKLHVEVNYFSRFNFISSDFINEYEIEYNQLKFGNIDLYVIEREEMKKMCLPFGGITAQNKIFTTNNEDIIQHELQHAFENVLGVGFLFKLWESEYTAFLAGIIFSDSKKSLKEIHEDVIQKNWNKDMEEFYEKDTHYKARLQVVSDLYDMKVDRRSSEEEIKHAALILLNNIYKKRTGMSYEEIMEEVKKWKK